jgi:prolyl oligopeptidase
VPDNVISAPPFSEIEPVTETLHGVPITDPYRWLEDQNSPRTKAWIAEQTLYARSYLDHIPGRERIRERIRQLLDVETHDSLLIVGNRYFFRKRLPGQEQPSIYMREGVEGTDELVLDPRERATGNHTAIKPLRVSPDGRSLLYEVKEGGERTGTFELVDIETRERLPDSLPRGYLRGFAFAPDSTSFYFVHEALDAQHPFYRAAYHHVLGTARAEDSEIFCAGEGKTLRLNLVSGATYLGFLVYEFLRRTQTDFYLKPLDRSASAIPVLSQAEFTFGPRFISDRLFAITDRDAPNLRIVELRSRGDRQFDWIDRVAEQSERIRQWMVAGERIVVSYSRGSETRVSVYDLEGHQTTEWPVRHSGSTVRLIGGAPDRDEIGIEVESFNHPPAALLCSVNTSRFTLWAQSKVPFDPERYAHRQVRYTSKDGAPIPMFLVGRRDVIARGPHPTIMTSYGGYGISMTPAFSVFAAFLMERGCLFALPSIRGGSEFGAAWHAAAKRRNRQTAFDDFLCAAEWLIRSRRTIPGRLAIFGGSNSGLLVGAALTQRPDLFRAVVCMVPMLDMLRYQLFDNAHIWKGELGTADDPEDFAVLSQYSPYHRVRDGVEYPATMIVSGDADANCNPLHARKMTARLQAASGSEWPIFLDYSRFRGHSPVLPLSDRIEGLTDRMAFLCDQLQLPR